MLFGDEVLVIKRSTLCSDSGVGVNVRLDPYVDLDLDVILDFDVDLNLSVILDNLDVMLDVNVDLVKLSLC